MRLFNKIKKHYEKLLVVPIVLMFLITASMIGFAYSSVTSDVINSDNEITFSRVGGEVKIIKGNVRIETEIISLGNDETGLAYNIIAIDAITSGKPIELDIQGPFCVYINGYFTAPVTVQIYGNTYSNTKTAGYYTLIDSGFKKTNINEIITGDKWIPNVDVTNFAFYGITHIPKDSIPFKIIFKN